MRKLWTSADNNKMESLMKELFRAGIRCEVRGQSFLSAFRTCPTPPELWVANDGDFLRAAKVMDEWRCTASKAEGSWTNDQAGGLGQEFAVQS
jgi:hypothetical protein